VAINALPAESNGRIAFGCLNNFCKVNEPMLELWANVLKQTEGSTLAILADAGSHRQRVLEILAREGIETHRVEFVSPRPRRQYLELYHGLDIVLDTFPYNGHTTSLDALWMGVPVVSLAGQQSVSRAGLSQSSSLGLPELVAFNEEDYVKIAVQLANDLPRLAELRGTLRQRMESSVLMDAPRFARQIEAAYRAMWREWCAQETGK
jgi:predicted O-linked N-acetylglucosamine transferase (SPINDLY family)